MEYLAHYGIKGQKWGVRRYQNPDGTRTAEGKKRYSSDEKSKNINPKTALKVGAAVAGTAAVAYLAANPKAREAAKKIVASSSKKLVSGLKNSAVRAGKAMVDGAMISIGGLAVDKLARELKKTEDGSDLTRARNKVIVDATRAGVNAAVRRNGSNSSNGGQVSKEVSDALGPPSKNSVDKNSSTYQGFFKDPSGNLRDDNVRSVIKGLVNAGYDADQINDYLRRIDNGSLKHYLLGDRRMDYLIHMADGEILEHHGIKGMKWGVRRYQNADGTLTSAGRKRYGPSSSDMKTARKERNRTRNEAAVAYNKAYNYTSAHPISQFTNKAKKQKSNDLWGDYYDKQKVADTAKDNYKQAVKENRKAKQESIKKAVSKYSKAYDEASDMSDSADEKWRAAREQYEKLGKTRVSRIIAAAKNKTSDAKKYSKLYDEASSMADVADEKWREVNSLYIKTGKTRVSRVINNFKYR